MQIVCPKKTLLLWQIRTALLGGLLTAASAFSSMLSLWFLIVPAVFSGCFLFLAAWYLPRFFGSYELLFQNGALVVTRGVWIQTTHIMPYAGLVYAQSFSTPLSKRFGLSGLTLKAARSRLTLPELPEKQTAAVMEILSKEETP